MFEKIRPLADRVLIKRLPKEEKTLGGIIIPDTAQEKEQTGSVIAIGTGRLLNDGTLIPMNVKIGDIVYFGKYSGTEVSADHIIIKEEEILGILEK